MNSLRIVLFGCPRTSHDGTRWFRQETRQADGLLAYLLLHGPRLHPRETLAGLFWGELSENRARNALNTTLWRIRKRLEPAGLARGTYLQTPHMGEVGLNWQSNLWFDVGAFETGVREVVDQPKPPVRDDAVLDRVQAALELYEGELLEGFCYDWILRQRERLRSLYFQAHIVLMKNAIAQREWERALTFGQRILEQDPVRESIHREVIRVYLRLGRRTQALRQYEQCVDTLRAELDVEPMEETRALHVQIVGGHEVPKFHCTTDDAQIENLLRELRLALNAAAQASERLRSCMERGRSAPTDDPNSN